MRTAAVSLLLLTACSSGVTRPVVQPPLPRPSYTAPDPAGVTSTRPFAWDHVAYVDPWTLDVHYVAGVEPCFNLAEVRVEESDTTVRITLFEGNPPLPDPTYCVSLGISARTRVTLSDALGTRRVVDGAAAASQRPVRRYS